jgi:polysaccharide export outer membrane protein
MSKGELSMRQLWISALGALVLLLGLGGCASYPAPSSEFAGSAASEYLIGPGDNINVMVWRNPELSMVVPVRPDGKFTTPLVEDLQASGKTSTQLAREIEKRMEKYIQSPVVTVIVTGFVGPYSQQIRVIGEASKPQALPYRENMTLLDVMIAVGGITDFAAGNRASILRTVGGKQEQFGVRLHQLLKRGDVSANLPMRAGDVLIIPQSFF